MLPPQRDSLTRHYHPTGCIVSYGQMWGKYLGQNISQSLRKARDLLFCSTWPLAKVKPAFEEKTAHLWALPGRGGERDLHILKYYEALYLSLFTRLYIAKKRLKTVEFGWKWLKLLQSVKTVWKLWKTAENGWKLLKPVENDWRRLKQLKTVENGWKLLKTVQTGWKWLKMSKMAENGWKQ